jgi:riboflavin synthase
LFTGIIEQAGRVSRIQVREDGARLVVDAGPLAEEARLGDSVAVNGCCLTVVERQGAALAFDAVTETLRRTNLGTLAEGDRVNLERPLRAGGRLDGHIVQGHVDGTAVLESVTDEGNARRLRFRPDPELLRDVVETGSIAVDGISLTVAAVAPDWFEVVIIPHTWEVTNLAGRREGSAVNLEVDILAKYVERLLAGRGTVPACGA